MLVLSYNITTVIVYRVIAPHDKVDHTFIAQFLRSSETVE